MTSKKKEEILEAKEDTKKETEVSVAAGSPSEPVQLEMDFDNADSNL